MNTLCNLDYFELNVNRFGELVYPFCAREIGTARDLFVICHGWNADMNDARGLYQNFFNEFCRIVTPRQCAVLGIFWPSEKYADPALTPGGAAGLGTRIDAARRILTYRVMKQRAGLVGRRALAPVLDQIQAALTDVRVHLVGHSFGARVITAAAAVCQKPVASMTLLQAAFSQYSFAPEGAFRNVIGERKCAGPILVTHSVHDRALRFCYPIASRVLRQNASGLGGANDRYGALGRNGALHTPEASFGELLPEGAPYSFAPGRIFNLRADRIIRAHADIVKPETAWALVAAAGLENGL